MKKSKITERIRIILRCLEYLKPHKVFVAVVVMLSVARTFLNLVPTYLLMPLTDKVFAPLHPAPTPERIHLLKILILAMLGSFLIELAINTLIGYFALKTGERMGVSLRKDLYLHIQRLPLKFFGLQKAGEIASKFTNDTYVIQSFLINHMLNMLSYIFLLIGMVSVLFYLNWRLTLIVLLPVPVLVIVNNFIGKKMRIAYRKMLESTGSLNVNIYNTITGIAAIKTLATESFELSAFNRKNEELYCAKVKSGALGVFSWPIYSFIVFLSGVLIQWVGGIKVIGGAISFGELMVFVGYMGRFYEPIGGLNNIYTESQNASAAGERVFGLLDEKTEYLRLKDSIQVSAIEGRILFEDVTFSYDGKKNVIQDLNLLIPPGDVLGLTGPNGSGKSTLAALICRLFDVSKGSIYIDEYNILQIEQQSLRKQIGLVLQDTLLFYGTIADNISCSKPEATMSEILSVAKDAGVHDFVVRLPDGYDTLVGERGVGLSVGEKQRLAIARVLLKNPKIIILDETTSSVDAETELRFHQAIKRLAGNYTIIIISHRPSTLKLTRRIIVFTNGVITETGTYESLAMNDKGYLYSLLHKIGFTQE